VLSSLHNLEPALHTALIACAIAIGACWLLSLATREYSWVDRLWSVMPPLYVAWFALATAGPDPRAWVMAALVALWGARLTFNFARKGGYTPGGEDYRWAELRLRMSPFAFQLFNLGFIAMFQQLLLLGISLPALQAQRGSHKPFGVVDALLCALFLAFLLGESVADEQQWRFQREKRAQRERGVGNVREFLTAGLFRYSRHPNFFCEQAQWWTFYALGAWASERWVNLTIVGPVVLTALFHGSTNFTEAISLRKYPEYARYQARVSRLAPWFAKPDPASAETAERAG
jgi:steroid 5-alpha reductase family enzyme